MDRTAGKGLGYDTSTYELPEPSEIDEDELQRHLD
jgi:hypothetical protein